VFPFFSDHEFLTLDRVPITSMPADTAKNYPRRTSRKVVNEEETELKRARGEISCAECRRFSRFFNFELS
jgi:hypothetical protein